ncbi:MAG: acetyl-CoA carboxylase biotin carboxylase subunit [Deltaproteobacteria bacterium]|nr:acetyl-CoA carboxylase biotin carboxylase subunit [Deltaproteobacteria bacterium]
MTQDGNPLFDKVLVANRGEIACRVIRACRARGIRTVAVFSEADRRALHVRMADEAWCIGPPPSRESYLRGDRILDVARRSGAQAIHPGYGFLSENAGFRRQCEEAGVVFIGPPAKAMELMGEKTLARQTMIAAGVPVVPGTAQPLADLAELTRVAAEVGYPIMLKAAAGGGGKGMRIVADPQQLASAFEGARREARSSFGDDAVYVEKAIVGPRHIEVQLLADRHGNVVWVGDRECSVQRRHQKVIEESPAPNLSEATRRQMGEMAVQAARAVGYEGAGTVECLVDQSESFYFLEMNTRLQVEHCATEEAFGVDLVDAQLQVAAGLPLPFDQASLVARRHAIELRVYAEDPYQNDMPSPGVLTAYRPPRGPGVRVDDGVEDGSEVSSLYDPMVAKLIVSAGTRDAAIARGLAALREYAIEGIHTNLPLLHHVLESAPFRAGRYTTGLLAELPRVTPPVADEATEDLARVLAALAVDARAPRQVEGGVAGGGQWTPWALDGLRRQLGGGL